MTRAQAQRIRFGILAARHGLEGCEASGWRKEDAWAAYKREACKAAGRVLLGPSTN